MEKSSQELFQQVNSMRDEYYEQNGKNRIFKSSQKNQLATEVCNRFNLQQMIQHTSYIIPNSNKLYFSYPLFKTYGNPENCGDMSMYVKEHLITQILQTRPNFEMHVNLKGFTVSACQRFFSAIKWLFDENTDLTERMVHLYIYHTPNVIDQIRKLLYLCIQSILDKITYYHKDSDDKIAVLHNF